MPGFVVATIAVCFTVKRRPTHKHAKSRTSAMEREGAPPPIAARPDSGPLFIMDRDAIREIDRLAVAEFGVPSILLMENAARHVSDVALEWVEEIDRPRVLVVCGHGHNGGDGLAVARHLSNAGLDVSLALTEPEERFVGDAAVHYRVARRMGLPMHTLDRRDARGDLKRMGELRGGMHLVVDAVLGTGLDRPVVGHLGATIDGITALREAGAIVLAVDLPSGMDADTGEALGRAVMAEVTVTFVGLKPGFLTPSGRLHVGEVVVADIGAPRGLIERLGKKLSPALGARRLSDHRSRLRPPPPPKPRRRRRPG